MWDFTIINLDEAMERVLGHKEMYIRWLDKFFMDETLDEIKKAYSGKDYTAAHAATHKIKGTAANLSILSVTDKATVLDDLVKLKADFSDMSEAYDGLLKAFNEAAKMYLENKEFINNH